MILNSENTPYKASFYTLLFEWQRSTSLWFLAISSLISILHATKYLPNFDWPAFPLSIFGGVLGIFISFRTNSAYQRWWEGRKLWGRMINTSRHICAQAVTYLSAEEAKLLVYRQIAYVHGLRCILRDEDPHQDQHFCRIFTEEERESFKGKTNLNHSLLIEHFKQLKQLRDHDEITEFFLSDFDESIRHLLDIQGGAERIKKTPFPPIYGHLGIRMTQIYSILFPLFLVSQLGWFTIPVSFLVCITLHLINEVGRTLENPFTQYFPALPLSAISLTIERDLRQALGESELPEPEAAKKYKLIEVMM